MAQKVDKSQWRSILDRASKSLVGKRAAIEIAALNLGHQVEAEWLPLLGVTYDPGDDIVEALFRAYFLEGLDVGDIDILAAIAARCGFGSAEVRSYLAGEAGTNEVRAEDRRARQLGIHAVPCFVLERGYAISGAQDPEMFLSLFDVACGIGNPLAEA